MEIPPSLVGIASFLLVFVLIALRLPIAFAFASIGFLGLWYFKGFEAALANLSLSSWENLTNYVLTCLPLFMLMGEFANYSGIGPDLYQTALKWFGRLPGGLAHTTVWGCAAFAAVTGSSTAGVLTFTPMAYQPMIDLGYDKRLASGAIIASATMGIIIPPSIPFILYALITDTSIGKLFMSGVFPGILQAVSYTILIFFLTGFGIQAGPPGPDSSWKEKIISLKKVWGMLTVFLLVIGGIYTGFTTPTEAAAVGVAGTFTILLLRQGLNLKLLGRSIEQTVRSGGMILLIILTSLIFSDVLVLSGLADWLGSTVTGSGLNPYVSLTIAIIVLFIFGCVMPSTPMILLFVPLFFPVFVTGLGFDAIWFGVIIIMMTELAVITPPIGMNLFAMKSVLGEKISMANIFESVLPFVLVDVLRVIILVAFPVIALWLPGKMF